MTKIEQAKNIIRKWSWPQEGTALLCSFGKDSMVLLHLIRETMAARQCSVSSYPVPIIYYKNPFFPFKNDFANRMITSWALDVIEPMPGAVGIKYNDDMLEFVARYHFGWTGFDVPINTLEPLPRRSFACGLKDWIERPKIAGITWNFSTVFHGHKSSDVDPFEGAVPLIKDTTDCGGTTIVFPLRDWTDDDVWDYIESNYVPFDNRRYADRKELEDKWNNPDYIHACTLCCDPREKSSHVYCPKLEQNVPNVGNRVLRLQARPDYIEAMKG